MSRYLKENGNLIPLERYNADNGLSTTSENAVQNKVITQEILDTKAEIESGLSGKSGRFEQFYVKYSNSTSVTVAGGKGMQIPMTKESGADTTGCLHLGITSFSTGNAGISPVTLYQNNLYVRNLTSSSITLSAGSVFIGSAWLRWL